MAEHFNQPKRRRAEFIKPPNHLKSKLGSGGLSDDILDKAQALLENNTVDFRPLGEMYLDNLKGGIDQAKTMKDNYDTEYIFSTMLYPAMQLKANGGMFHYPLVTSIADKLIQFLEVLEKPDDAALEIIGAFHTTIKSVLTGRVKGDGGRHGAELQEALVNACMRYFEKYPDNVDARLMDGADGV